MNKYNQNQGKDSCKALYITQGVREDKALFKKCK